MEAELTSPDYISGKVEGEIKLGSRTYRVRGTDYGSSFHLSVESENCSYSKTHNYSEISNFENSLTVVEELFQLSKENIDSWDSEDELLYIGETDLDELSY